MDTKILIAFAIGLGCYFVALVVFVIVKNIRYKRKFKKQLKEKQDEEKQDKPSGVEIQDFTSKK